MRKPGWVVTLLMALALMTGCAHSQLSGAHAPVLNKIMERGELVVGMAGSMPPLNMTTVDGVVIGYEPDMAALIARAMGVELRIETMKFAQLLPALQEGKVDMILSNMTITPDRNLKVAFVGPYFSSGKAFLTKIRKVAEAVEPGIVNTPDITLVALKGSTSQYFIESSIPDAKLVTTDTYDEAVKMVIEDKAHGLLADYPICVVSLYRYPNKGLLSVITPMTYEPIGIAVPANDPLLVNWLQNYLDGLDGSGYLDELERRWIGDAAWLEKLP